MNLERRMSHGQLLVYPPCDFQGHVSPSRLVDFDRRLVGVDGLRGGLVSFVCWREGSRRGLLVHLVKRGRDALCGSVTNSAVREVAVLLVEYRGINCGRIGISSMKVLRDLLSIEEGMMRIESGDKARKLIVFRIVIRDQKNQGRAYTWSAGCIHTEQASCSWNMGRSFLCSCLEEWFVLLTIEGCGEGTGAGGAGDSND
jgi:hypothetical protein